MEVPRGLFGILSYIIKVAYKVCVTIFYVFDKDLF
ncbi:uncharacterized protein FTOL_12939 [Fusarium torulosum]|uniref:Uncharacterized protein n=1 Tax=Fusarium torulosum TaxID=33205 RepID=A0AAE8MNF8_9HYPO|nr:uncharacterized protein FTOL_12939 [Fusarium torulosum]